ncbi:sensor histidine kinase [Phormidesmis sp. 146-12]
MRSPIQLDTSSPKSLSLTLRYLDWSLIGVGLLLGLVGEGYAYPQTLTFQTCIASVAYIILSFFIPINGSISQRRIYVSINLILAIWLSLVSPIAAILHWSIIKSCFLLNLKEVVLTIALTSIFYVVGTLWSIPQFSEMLTMNGIQVPDAPKLILMGNIAYYLGACIFSILMSLLVMAERKSRQTSELLATEVETLAASLERSRIAREIHDSLGHTLTTLDIQIEVAQRLQQRNPEKALQALENAKRLSSQCLQDVRSTVQTIRQPTFNLNRALTTLVEQVNQSQQFAMHVDLDLPDLPLNISHPLYCIIQEGLTNIQKHAHASSVSLHAGTGANTLIIELDDNGRGFELEKPRSGFGLQGIEERVSLLGGEFTLYSQLGQGTQLRVKIPQ